MLPAKMARRLNKTKQVIHGNLPPPSVQFIWTLNKKKLATTEASIVNSSSRSQPSTCHRQANLARKQSHLTHLARIEDQLNQLSIHLLWWQLTFHMTVIDTHTHTPAWWTLAYLKSTLAHNHQSNSCNYCCNKYIHQTKKLFWSRNIQILRHSSRPSLANRASQLTEIIQAMTPH